MDRKVFEHYRAFYNMVLSTTILSNKSNEEFEKNASNIIDFIGESFKLDSSLVAECKKIILDDLTILSIMADCNALYSTRTLGSKINDADVLLDIKCDVLTKLNSLSNDAMMQKMGVNQSWFDYHFFKSYQPNVRYNKINIASSVGNLICTKQVGIMKALGIGTKQDYSEAIKRFLQAALWGDVASLRYLSYVYTLIGNQEKACIFNEISELSSQYLRSGITELSDEVKKQYHEQAICYYAIISSIRQDIILRFQVFNIDFSFVEVILKDDISFKKAMKYINEYKKEQWKEETNSSLEADSRIGFIL